LRFKNSRAIISCRFQNAIIKVCITRFLSIFAVKFMHIKDTISKLYAVRDVGRLDST